MYSKYLRHVVINYYFDHSLFDKREKEIWVQMISQLKKHDNVQLIKYSCAFFVDVDRVHNLGSEQLP